jgi:8-oxo-dGTP pyrophosphatase MutT (NUDIX family)
LSEAETLHPLPLAATIVLMRETGAGPPELLMLERASSMAFAAGALVFPGGRVETGDWAIADQLAGDRDETAQRVAAIRETIEESGIAIGLDPAPDAAALNKIRAGLAEGRDFADLLQEAGVVLDLAVLTPFARWRPANRVTRAYDTRFFLAAAPEGAIEDADGGESVRALWSTAQALLDDYEAGHHHVIFPTWCNLGRLAQFASLEAARADAALYAHHLASGRVEQRDGVDWFCIEEGIGYPATAMLLDEKLRG